MYSVSYNNFSYGVYKVDQFVIMDEDMVFQWVDVMIIEMMEVMLGVLIEQLFINFFEVLVLCNVQIERVIGFRFQFFFGVGVG